ncbi:galactosylgalactosylxylosylprotein 3-beta-glucuronosyltransferase S isoform X2 [Spodoptera frugiperda]|uniref:Galactosylgalactosylxylosylprotein 3-beta-glucuronosyltransferase n=1 Tax=Spodoptera frugiperda TaxID=7108 RepID=A0A2H1V9Z4_SPOFR|nr:galactosylgalactosylxylosylprotein 3-beta-glucuronosyltransferase S isoform X2 [Spodoptera frugiperda]
MASYKVFKKSFVMAIIISTIVFVFFWANMELVSSGMMKEIPLNVKNKLCRVNFKDQRSYVNKTSDLKMIYFVTPTYPRPEQAPELTRLAHTLMHVPRLHWIVADDQPICSDVVYDILRRSGLPYTHISSPKPFKYQITNFPRGVANRRAALAWLRDNVHEGVLYFGDDDNTVDLQLFDEIRNTKKVSMFPVGLIGDYGVSSPVVTDGKVVAFFDSWVGSRTFPVDMAGFAINIKFLKDTAYMPYKTGLEEDRFLVSLGLKFDEIEPLADNCSKILVWHTKTLKKKKRSLKIDIKMFENSQNYRDFAGLLKETSRLGMADVSSVNGSNAYIFLPKQHKLTETSMIAPNSSK